MDRLDCTIERLVFQNPDNGYSVFQVSKKDDIGWHTIVGTFQNVAVGMTLAVEGEWKNSKFGRQFSVETYREVLPATVKGIESYLGSGLIRGIGKVYAKKIVRYFGLETFDILSNSPERLLEVDGVGKSRMEKIKDSWEEQKGVNDIMIFLQGHGVSPTYAVKIYKQYGKDSIEKFRGNPYALADDVFGIGFKIADQIAMGMGYEKNDSRRCKAGVLFTLKQLADNGHCYVGSGSLTKTAAELLEVSEDLITEAMNHLVFEQSVIQEEDNYFLPMYYYSEKGVAGKIKFLLSRPCENSDVDIAKISEETKIEYDDIQADAIRQAMRSKVMVLTGGPGCVDCNTEYFNGKEWRKISDYRNGDKVLQYNKDGSAELVKPLRYIKEPCENMTLIHSKYGVNQCVSDDHRIVYESEKGVFHINTTTEVKAMHQVSTRGFKGRFLTTFAYSGKGIDLTDAEIRLMCAVVCDGTFRKEQKNSLICSVNIKKQRKKERLERLLNDAEVSYTKHHHNPKDNEFVVYRFVAPRREKSFSDYWYDCTKHQLEVFCDEVLRWDGCFARNRLRFGTTVKETADFVQFAFSAIGYKARVITRDRVNKLYFTNGKIYKRKSKEYNISISEITKISVHNAKTKDNIIDVKSEDGYKYCFTVPSGMLVLRREGCINITGNCGKTTTISGIICALESRGNRILCAAPTGRAAKRMSEATQKEAMTIHRMLEYKPQEGFGRNEDNPLSGDVLIVDECSMIDVVLMNSLVKAVPKDMRLILVGDIDQLPSVGAGNVLRDIIDSEAVPVVRLTRIFRQALTSRIVTNAHRINHGEMPDTSNGKDADFFFLKQEDAALAANDIVDLVKDRIPKAYGYGVDDIQVLTPMKNGAVGTVCLNNAIQEAVNPNGDFIQCGQFKFRRGDKVMQIRNNYDKNVFNGDVGVIQSIDTEERIMNILFNGNVVEYEGGDLNELTLAYACTIHKSQGSEYPVVVMPLMMSHYIMLQRNLVYTGVTRAKKLCIIIGDNRALAYAVKNLVVTKRNTMLRERLNDK